MHKPQRPKSAKGRTRPSRYQRLFTSAPAAGTESSDGGKKLVSRSVVKTFGFVRN